MYRVLATDQVEIKKRWHSNNYRPNYTIFCRARGLAFDLFTLRSLCVVSTAPVWSLTTGERLASAGELEYRPDTIDE